MRLVTEKSKLIKGLMNIVGKMNIECALLFDSEGITIKVSETSNVAMMDVNITAKAFNVYECDNDESIMINMDDFNKVLSKVKERDILTIETDKSEIMVSSRGRYHKLYKLRLIDDEYQGRKWDSSRFKYGVSVTTDATLFQESISDMNVIGDNVKLICDSDGVFVIGYDEQQNEKGRVTLTKGTDKTTSYKFVEMSKLVEEDGKKVLKKMIPDKASSRYSTLLMNNVLNAKGLSSRVRLRWSDDGPIEIHYAVPDRFTLSYYQAPRVEND